MTRLQSIANPTSGNVAGHNGRKAAERAFCGGCMRWTDEGDGGWRRGVKEEAGIHLFGYRTMSCPRPAPPTINPANAPRRFDAARPCRTTRLGSVICLQAAESRTIKLSANRACVRARRAGTTWNVTVNGRNRRQQRGAFLALAIGSLVNPAHCGTN